MHFQILHFLVRQPNRGDENEIRNRTIGPLQECNRLLEEHLSNPGNKGVLPRPDGDFAAGRALEWDSVFKLLVDAFRVLVRLLKERSEQQTVHSAVWRVRLLNIGFLQCLR